MDDQTTVKNLLSHVNFVLLYVLSNVYYVCEGCALCDDHSSNGMHDPATIDAMLI